MIIRCCRALLVLLCLSLSLPLAAAGDPFPFGATLMLDAAPIRGSKRIPMLEIAEDGAASIDLWCATARAEAVVSRQFDQISLRRFAESHNASRSVKRAMLSFWRRWRRSQIGDAKAKLSNFWA